VTYFRNALIAELEGIGISREEKARRNLTFHGLRHTFVSLGRLAGLNDFAIQGLAGHKCSQSMNKYSHARKVVDPNACLDVFGKFLGKL
jgi:integrase